MKGNLLQRFAWPHALEHAELYARTNAACMFAGSKLSFHPGGTADLDCLFNSFFLAPWFKWTSVRDFHVEIECSGALHATLCWIQGNHEVDIAEWDVAGKKGELLRYVSRSRIALPAEAERGRIALRLSSASGAELHDIRFVTTDTPLRPVRLSVGICSFNRPESVRNLIEVLRRQKSSSLVSIIVVEQGDKRVDASNFDVGKGKEEAASTISFIQQANYGGSGGFTRSILEALALAEAGDDGPTHHVLMDDDILASSDLLLRLAAFLSFTKKDIAVGAPMLELETPWRMHEAGIEFRENRRRISIGRGLDVRRSSALSVFDDALAPDAHAWWCWAAPLSEVRRAGGPLNLFIKYDDIEYTHRLLKKGVPTAVLPTASIWHEAFAHKPAEWRSYYTMRNECIFQTLHQPSRAWATSPAWNNVWPAILRHDYARAQLMIDAIDAFLSGPIRALPSDSASEHAKLMKRYKELRPRQIARRELPADCAPCPRNSPSDLAALVALIFGTSHEYPHFVTETAFEPAPTAVGAQTYARFVACSDIGDLMKRKLGRSLILMWELLRVHWKFLLWKNSVRETWLQHYENADPSFAKSSFEKWQACFESGAPAL